MKSLTRKTYLAQGRTDLPVMKPFAPPGGGGWQPGDVVGFTFSRRAGVALNFLGAILVTTMVLLFVQKIFL